MLKVKVRDSTRKINKKKFSNNPRSEWITKGIMVLVKLKKYYTIFGSAINTT